ncbi:tetrapyrrole methylase [Gloeophyllum trabeum ATCC 11539]|uniref:precorrin-2 dehydrogenase n=1 Tax=Gloeophyllum trabeum (strain ATCC 11539 / FP-39264 / Madison 617) TaxID=670483 RepID=S7QLF6_GLOTA|nr:tetrapyrrole methylase [Gloeophyllum trabeum ATCC 11539]EPQ60177.1 tetrapyrrole methylase [Gloeophyllum trabeum ATCC 11539]
MVSYNYPAPKGGASLMLSFRPQTVLILGSNTIAAARAFAALESEADVIVLSKGGAQVACEELQYRAQEGEITLLDLSTLPRSSSSSDAAALDAYITNSRHQISLICVTDTVLGSDESLRRSKESAQEIYGVCQARNIPVNITDMPELCDFSFASTHRFNDPCTSEPTPLQIAVTTNGQGCRLAGRIRRDIVASLPKGVGCAVKKMGLLRGLAKALDVPAETEDDVEQELNEETVISTPNRPVPQRQTNTVENEAEAARRRMKWVAQVSEYWPIDRLANMTDEDMSTLLHGGEDMRVPTTSGVSNTPLAVGSSRSRHALCMCPLPTARKGRILLVGSGPGHPSLLTVATHAALTKHADLVLSDKLVPAAVLSLIPMHVEVRIARKFPGNAEGAQIEMMEAAVEAAKRGLTVVRLKQGDPTVYGRAGEEVLYFRAHGFEPLVVPGVSSALAGPTLAGIPVTQRGVAESFIVCTGVGRQGTQVMLPGYERGRTLLILMGVARLPQVLKALTNVEATDSREGPAYPPSLPIAVIERASMPDQRSICSTLDGIAAALESAGEQRPPGMIVVGWSVLALCGEGNVDVLDRGAALDDETRVKRWLAGNSWRISEGLDSGWEALL